MEERKALSITPLALDVEKLLEFSFADGAEENPIEEKSSNTNLLAKMGELSGD